MLELLLTAFAVAKRRQLNVMSEGHKLNVKGTELQKCCGSGMALTGFTRSGSCEDHNDDAGSHHVCIDMSSTTGGNFGSVTGQPNWCGSSMACDGSAGALLLVDCVVEEEDRRTQVVVVVELAHKVRQALGRVRGDDAGRGEEGCR